MTYSSSTGGNWEIFYAEEQFPSFLNREGLSPDCVTSFRMQELTVSNEAEDNHGIQTQHMFCRKLEAYLIYKRKGPTWPAVFPQAAFLPISKAPLKVHSCFLYVQKHQHTFHGVAAVCDRVLPTCTYLCLFPCMCIKTNSVTLSSNILLRWAFWLILCATLLNAAPWFVVVPLSLFHVFKLPFTEIQVKSLQSLSFVCLA